MPLPAMLLVTAVACSEAHDGRDASDLDAAVVDASVLDARIPDGQVVRTDARFAPADAGPPRDGGPARELVMGDGFLVTSDDYLAFTNEGAVWVVPLDGGVPVRVAPGSLLGEPRTPVVWAHDGAFDAPGALVVWTASVGPRAMTSAFDGLLHAASRDGRFIAFGERGEDGHTSLVLAATGDDRRQLVLDDVLCRPRVAFSGDWLVFETCSASGPHDVEIARITGERRTLGRAYGSFVIDAASERVLIAHEDGSLVSHGPEGPEVVLDADIVHIRDASGGVVAYEDASGALRTSMVSSPTPRIIAPAPAPLRRRVRVSPDGAWLTFASACDEGPYCNLHVAATDGSWGPLTVDADLATAAPFFTGDGAFLVYSRAGGPASAGVVARGGTPVGTIEGSLLIHWLAGGSRVLVADPFSLTPALRAFHLPDTRGEVVAPGQISATVTQAGDRVVYKVLGERRIFIRAL